MKFFLYITLVLIPLMAQSQESNDTARPPVLRKKEHFNVSMGTSFGSWGGQSFNSSYINPSMSQQVNTKLHMTTGMMLFNNSFGAMGPSMRSGSGYNNGLVYLEGTYKMNRKLTFSAGGFTNMNGQGPQSNMNFYNNYERMNGMSFGFNYLIGRNMVIGGSFHFRNGGLPGYYSPFRSLYNSPFSYYDSFYSPFGW